jgi:hypothetical protein
LIVRLIRSITPFLFYETGRGAGLQTGSAATGEAHAGRKIRAYSGFHSPAGGGADRLFAHATEEGILGICPKTSILKN